MTLFLSADILSKSKMIDLHTHSTASDGQYSPTELVEKAKNALVSVLALTDHDTVQGLEEAEAAAKNAGITFVRGVELNIAWTTGEFHLLGLGLKDIKSDLRAIIKELSEARRNRNRKIVAKMQEAGIAVTLEELESLYPAKSLGRPHFADFLVKQKVVRHKQDAFDKYLAKGRPFYEAKEGADLDIAVNAIVDSGGVPVIAHPLSLYLSWSKIEPVLRDVHERGVAGLEAWHPGAREQDCKRLEAMAREIGFFITAGSDFHGEKVRADRKLGHTAGNRKIDDAFYADELLPHLSR